MDEKLYDLCDWAEIETIVYSEHDNPHNILGAHKTEAGILINVFMPRAVSIRVKLSKTEKEYNMELADEAGFFAVLIPGKRIPPYTYLITYDNGSELELTDPYNFEPLIDASDMKKFSSGIHYDIFNKLGAHVSEINGTKGVYFAVWAPNAIRVSVVGDFNIWDGRRHPMRRLLDSGIFEIFIPELKEGEIYKYEIKIKGGLIMLKADPYGYYSELRPATASVVTNIDKYEWTDDKWLGKRKGSDYTKEPMSIYEVHLGSWRKPEEEERDFYNYRELAPMLADYVKEMGYTHIELMPIMEHPFDASWGYQVTGYYAPTSRYGTPDDFMYFMDYMHNNEIGVILDWVPAHFPRDTFGLANFDGTCLYEHLDPRQGSHPHWGTLIYNYGRPQVANFLIANTIFWVEKYHADAIRMDAVASMLYLDYGKNDGEWVANIYGGNENLDAIEFLKHLNSVMKGRKDGAIVIAEESTAWPKISGDIEDGGLGFDLKWNMGWMNDFINYIKTDPLFRKGKHGELTFSLIYAYSEKFILVLSHDEVVHGKGSMINKMPGEYEQKFENLRVAYGFMMTHPGKKLLFMGQDFAQFSEWSEEKSLDWELLEYDAHKQMREYMKSLNRFYKDYPALHQMDFDSDGFEWINNMDSERSVVSFLRKTEREEDTLLVICNFTPVTYDDFTVGVPFKGKYKETFNSDNELFGGSGNVNPRMKQSKEFASDGRNHSITVVVPPLGITVFTCKPIVTEGSKSVKKPSKKTVVRKAGAAEKKTEDKKVSAIAKKAAAVKDTVKKTVKSSTAKKGESSKKTDTQTKEELSGTEGKQKLSSVKSKSREKAQTKRTSRAETKVTNEKKAEPKVKLGDKAEPKVKIEDKAEPKAKITDKAEPKVKIEDKTEPKARIADKAEPKAKIADKTEPKAKIADKTEPKVKIEDKTEPKVKIEDKTEPKAKIADKTEPKVQIADKTEPKVKIEDKTEPKAKIADKAEPKVKIEDKTEAKEKIEDKTEPKTQAESGLVSESSVKTDSNINISAEPNKTAVDETEVKADKAVNEVNVPVQQEKDLDPNLMTENKTESKNKKTSRAKPKTKAASKAKEKNQADKAAGKKSRKQTGTASEGTKENASDKSTQK